MPRSPLPQPLLPPPSGTPSLAPAPCLSLRPQAWRRPARAAVGRADPSWRLSSLPPSLGTDSRAATGGLTHPGPGCKSSRVLLQPHQEALGKESSRNNLLCCSPLCPQHHDIRRHSVDSGSPGCQGLSPPRRDLRNEAQTEGSKGWRGLPLGLLSGGSLHWCLRPPECACRRGCQGQLRGPPTGFAENARRFQGPLPHKLPDKNINSHNSGLLSINTYWVPSTAVST